MADISCHRCRWVRSSSGWGDADPGGKAASVVPTRKWAGVIASPLLGWLLSATSGREYCFHFDQDRMDFVLLQQRVSDGPQRRCLVFPIGPQNKGTGTEWRRTQPGDERRTFPECCEHWRPSPGAAVRNQQNWLHCRSTAVRAGYAAQQICWDRG